MWRVPESVKLIMLKNDLINIDKCVVYKKASLFEIDDILENTVLKSCSKIKDLDIMFNSVYHLLNIVMKASILIKSYGFLSWNCRNYAIIIKSLKTLFSFPVISKLEYWIIYEYYKHENETVHRKFLQYAKLMEYKPEKRA